MTDPIYDSPSEYRPAPDLYADQRCGCGHLHAHHDLGDRCWWCNCHGRENGGRQ